MEFLPEWAPNVYPILVHFPIALLVIAVLFDGAALFLRKQPGVRTAAVALFTLGAIAALAAFFTGRAAADEILLPAHVWGSVQSEAEQRALQVAVETMPGLKGVDDKIGILSRAALPSL